MKRSEILFRIASLVLVIKLLAAYTLNIDNIHMGEYRYQYDTDDIWNEQEGKIDENGDQFVNGSYLFYDGDVQYIVEYYADKTGYHPTITVKDPTDTHVGVPPRFLAGGAG